MSMVALLNVAVKRVLGARRLVGENVTTEPEQPMVPLTTVRPGPVTVNAPAASGQVIGSLKVALISWSTGTPVAVFNGFVDTTASAGESVLNVHT